MGTIITITLFWGDGSKGKQIDYTNIRIAKKELVATQKIHGDARLYYSKDVNDTRLFYYCYHIVGGKIKKEDINFNN